MAATGVHHIGILVSDLAVAERFATDVLGLPVVKRLSIPAAAEIEHAINQKQLEEARREIDLLREFDRDNFTLALLGGKLSAARNIVTKQHEAEAARIRQTTAAGM